MLNRKLYGHVFVREILCLKFSSLKKRKYAETASSICFPHSERLTF